MLPYLKQEFNPNIIETLNRLANIAKEENDYFDSMIEKEFGNIVIEEEKEQIGLDLKKFNELELVIKKRMLLYTINKLLRNCQRYWKGSYGRYDKTM